MRPLRPVNAGRLCRLKEGPVVRIEHPDGEHSAITSIASDERCGARIGLHSAVYASVLGRCLKLFRPRARNGHRTDRRNSPFSEKNAGTPSATVSSPDACAP